MDNSDVRTRLAAATAALEETRQLVEDTYRGVNGSVSLLGKALGYGEEQPSDDRGNNMSAAAQDADSKQNLTVALNYRMESGYFASRSEYLISVYQQAEEVWDKEHKEHIDELPFEVEE